MSCQCEHSADPFNQVQVSRLAPKRNGKQTCSCSFQLRQCWAEAHFAEARWIARPVRSTEYLVFLAASLKHQTNLMRSFHFRPSATNSDPCSKQPAGVALAQGGPPSNWHPILPRMREPEMESAHHPRLVPSPLSHHCYAAATLLLNHVSCFRSTFASICSLPHLLGRDRRQPLRNTVPWYQYCYCHKASRRVVVPSSAPHSGRPTWRFPPEASLEASLEQSAFNDIPSSCLHSATG